ncbi:single-stranded DNA-binding protein [Microbacterium sp. 179-I 3D4 NHS]|uniref:single-stranded DNA-binding protein n=1 Tax=Microbacterium sp. 179-I 3D4 NHS TaxID=3142381 RepID=UPI0039A3D938
MTDTLTIVGKVATDPTLGRTGGGVPVTNFRLASTHRRFDAASQSWVDAGTNWYSVAAYRQLGEHAKASLRTGDSVIVTGRLRIRNWESNGKSGTSVDIDAEAIGHDLRWGTSAYLRSSRSTPEDPSPNAGDEQQDGPTGAGSAEGDSAGDAEGRSRVDASWAATDAAASPVPAGTPF